MTNHQGVKSRILMLDPPQLEIKMMLDPLPPGNQKLGYTTPHPIGNQIFRKIFRQVPIFSCKMQILSPKIGYTPPHWISKMRLYTPPPWISKKMLYTPPLGNQIFKIICYTIPPPLEY